MIFGACKVPFKSSLVLFPVAKSRDFTLLDLHQQSELATYDSVRDFDKRCGGEKRKTTELKFFKNWPEEPGTFSFSVLEKLKNSSFVKKTVPRFLTACSAVRSALLEFSKRYTSIFSDGVKMTLKFWNPRFLF